MATEPQASYDAGGLLNLDHLDDLDRGCLPLPEPTAPHDVRTEARCDWDTLEASTTAERNSGDVASRARLLAQALGVTTADQMAPP